MIGGGKCGGAGSKFKVQDQIQCQNKVKGQVQRRNNVKCQVHPTSYTTHEWLVIYLICAKIPRRQQKDTEHNSGPRAREVVVNWTEYV